MIPAPSATSCAYAERTFTVSACDVKSKEKSENPTDLPYLTKWLAQARAVWLLLSRVDPLSEEQIQTNVGVIAALRESDRPSEGLAPV